MRRIRVVHRTLGELLGVELARSGGQVKIKLDQFEQTAIVGARYVSDAEGVGEGARDGQLAK